VDRFATVLRITPHYNRLGLNARHKPSQTPSINSRPMYPSRSEVVKQLKILDRLAVILLRVTVTDEATCYKMFSVREPEEREEVSRVREITRHNHGVSMPPSLHGTSAVFSGLDWLLLSGADQDVFRRSGHVGPSSHPVVLRIAR